MSTLHVLNRVDESLYKALIEYRSPDIRARALLLAVESRPTLFLDSLLDRAENDDSAYVRIHVASALQRVPLDQRWPIATALLNHSEDASDPNLPLMYWYAVEPLVARNVRKAAELLTQAKIPLVRQYIARRIVAVREGDGEPPPSSAWMLDELLRVLAVTDDTVRLDILRGFKEAYRGRRAVPAPATWKNVYPVLSKSSNQQVKDGASELGVLFGDRQLIALLLDTFFQQPRAETSVRRRALELLAAKRDPAFVSTLYTLLQDSELRPDAIRALGAYDAGEIPPRLVNLYASLNVLERQDAIQTLTARPMFALTLLDAIEQNIIPRQEVSALTIRQLQALGDERVNLRLTSVWGTIRRASADKQARAEQFKSQLSADVLKGADLSHGRTVFAKNCASCHKLFDEGSKIGPDLTGGQRHNLDYVLDNVIDPSAIVPREYKVNVFRLVDGRVVQGVITEENPQTVTVQTANETVSLPSAEIEGRKESPLSMMPEGLFDRLTAEEIRDLVAYLASPSPVTGPND